MGKLIEAAGHAYSGRAARKAAKIEAAQMIRKAGSTRATGQRAAAEEKRQARYVMSAARARAAASGGGVSDPTVVNIMADIEAQGEYNALSRLWEAEDEAIGLEQGARARRKEGKAQEILGYTRAVGTIVDSIPVFGGG